MFVRRWLDPHAFETYCFDPHPLLPAAALEDDPYAAITDEDMKWATQRPQTPTNPTATTDAFRVALIKRYFCPPGKELSENKHPHWNFYRNGQSFSKLEDDRIVFIAGEHEDFYDPNFRIYNDVITVDQKGNVEIFDYPPDVFPPTDFHTATLVNDAIYIIGSLGYARTRKTDTPVYRLDLKDFRIDKVGFEGYSPGRVYNHRAKLIDGPAILISGGKRVKFPLGIETHFNNEEEFVFDIPSRTFYRRA